ncbi:MAG: hypothetical protein AAF596_08500 [Planctomycetota bacterium]
MGKTQGKTGWLTKAAVALALLVVVAVAALSAVGLWRKAKVERRLATLRAAGEPVSLADLARPVPTRGNAALVLDGEALRTYASDNEGFGRYRLQLALPGRQPRVALMESVARSLAGFKPLLDAIDEAAACDAYVRNTNYVATTPKSLLNDVGDAVHRLKSVARLQSVRVRFDLARGDVAVAFEKGFDALRLAKLARRQPLIIGYLAGVASDGVAIDDFNRVLRSGQVDEAFRERLDEQLAKQYDMASLVDALRSERAHNLASFDSMGPDLGQWASSKLALLDYHEAAIPWIAAPPWKSTVPAPATRGNSLVQLMAPSVEGLRTAHWRMVALGRCLRVLNALQRFSEENGREASGLDELDLPDTVKTDPFSGKPLVCGWRENEDGTSGWWIYSMMENGVDDGGKFDDASDYGLAPLRPATLPTPDDAP